MGILLLRNSGNIMKANVEIDLSIGLAEEAVNMVDE
jgi:hypothetical protein